MSAPATAPCKHTQWTTAYGDRKMCTDCGHQCHGMFAETKNKPVPTSYQRRLLQLSPKGVRFPKTADHLGGGWKTEWFGTSLQPTTYAEAAKLIAQWNQACITSGMLVEYRLDTDLKCAKCGYKCHETYAGETCLACHMEDKKAMKKNKNDWMAGLETAKPAPFTKGPGNVSNQFQSPIKNPVLLKREEGDMWEIPATSSPLWTKQWAYQGSAKEPYIISKKKTTDGGTSADGWACSCRAFTQHSPRKDCKHIINVKHQYGLGKVTPAKAAIANMDSDEAAAFAEFQRQKAQNAKQKPESGDAELNLFGATGRKFR